MNSTFSCLIVVYSTIPHLFNIDVIPNSIEDVRITGGNQKISFGTWETRRIVSLPKVIYSKVILLFFLIVF